MMDAATSEALPEGTVIDGRYRVESLLGSGAMGVVYLVEHVHMRKRLALKVLSTTMGKDPEVVRRFEQEAFAAAHVDHPYVATARDFGRTEAGECFLVLDYVEGRSLRDVLGAGPLAPERAATIVRQMCSALAKAHQVGVVHRDLKPENVMLVQEADGTESIKILDFGIAKIRQVDRATPRTNHVPTRAGLVFGTPDYMSPEQALGEAVDARADLYSLGVMLYEMLCGKTPFDSDDPIAMLAKQITAPPPPIAQRAPDVVVPRALEAIAMKLLQKVPDERYQTATELGEALEGARSSQGQIPLLRGGTLAGALTSIGGIAADSIRDVVAALPQHASTVALVTRGRSKRTQLAALGGAAAALLLVVVLVGSALSKGARHGGGGDTTATSSNASQGTSAVAPPRRPALTDEAIQRARKEGVGALVALTVEHPRDPRVVRELALARAAAGDTAEALDAFASLIAMSPDAARDDELQKIWLAAFESRSAPLAQKAGAMLEGALGEAGVDLLLERSAQPNAPKARVNEWLSKPAVAARASPAAKIVLDLRAARTCEAKHAVVERAKDEGDKRALPQLRALSAPRGCGFLSLSDCWPCMRRDNALRDALAAIEPRGKSDANAAAASGTASPSPP